MNTRVTLAFLAAVTLSTGCVINGGHHNGPGDITFSWTFDGGRGCTAAGVDYVQISIPGEVLEDEGIYNCSTDGYPGIVLHDFNGGAYTFTIDAYDFGGSRVYSASGSFTVDGNTPVAVDLAAVGVPAGYAYLYWNFPANSASTNPSCGQAGVTTVYAKIDNGTTYHWDCAVGKGSSGAQTILLSGGNHNITLWATDNTGYTYYALDSVVKIPQDTAGVTFNLQWAVGGTNVRWQLREQGNVITCGVSNVNYIDITFENVATHEVLYGQLNDPTTWDLQTCSQGITVYSYLPPGTYNVYMRGTHDGALPIYKSDWGTPPRVTVVSGVFPAEATSTTVVLNRTN